MVRFAALSALLLVAAGGDDVGRRYDALLKDRDYGTLADALKQGMETGPTALPTLAWEQKQVVGGGSVFLDAAYALDLLAAGHDGRDPAADARTRENAVVAALYAVAAIQTDGVKCADSQGPAARRRQFGTILRPIWDELRKLPDDRVALDLGRALATERARADARPADDYLCRGRTADIPDVLAAGAAQREPHFLDQKEWLPRQVAARAQLPSLLADFAAMLKRGPGGG